MLGWAMAAVTGGRQEKQGQSHTDKQVAQTVKLHKRMNNKLAAKLNLSVSLQCLKVSAQIQQLHRLQHANKHSSSSSNLHPCTPDFKLKIAA